MKKKERKIRKTHLIKRRGLRRVCAVLALCFGVSAVVLPFVGSRKCLTVSASSTPVSVPENTYIISMSGSPSLYVDWGQTSQLTSMVYAPSLFISESGFYISFGSNRYLIPVNQDNVFCESPFYRYTSSGTTATNIFTYDKFGFFAHLGSAAAYSPSEFYNKLISGEIVISNVKFDNVVIGYSSTSYDNYFSYTIQCPNDMGVNYNALIVVCSRSEAVPTSFIGYSASSYDSNLPFSYVITYNGLSTSSAEYQQGYIDGKNQSNQEQYTLGYNAGKSVGYNEGVSVAYKDLTPWQVIVNGVNSFFNIEFIPGVRLSILLYTALGCVLLGVVIKLFLGG